MKESFALHEKKTITSGVAGGDAGLAEKKLIPIALQCQKNPLQPIENTVNPSATEPKMLPAVVQEERAAGGVGGGVGVGGTASTGGAPLHAVASTEVPPASSMSISTSPSTAGATHRICLVGAVAQDAATRAAAESLKLPIVTSETGAEYARNADDDDADRDGDDGDRLNTLFVLNDFEGPVYDALVRTKQRILGPPALQQAVRFSEGLGWNNRPIYNYCMRGVTTCFTGIRKKDELTHLVHLIHAMGGSIRKEMNTKITHLICSSSGGEKYRYAMTFRLAIIRPNWVLEAWKHRNDANFSATTEEFTKLHRVKAFDGQKVCFFGFPEEEEQDMINLLKKNGGIPTDLEDPECSHVVMPNTGVHFADPSMVGAEALSPRKPPVAQSPPLADAREETDLPVDERSQQPQEEQEGKLHQRTEDERADEKGELAANAGSNGIALPALPEENESPMAAAGVAAAHLLSIAENDNNRNVERRFRSALVASPSMQFIDEESESDVGCGDNRSEPVAAAAAEAAAAPKHDGIVLTSGEANEFLDPNNISPILKCGPERTNESIFHRIDEDDEEEEEQGDDVDDYVIATREAYKRKRPEDSFDDPSLLSMDISMVSTAAFGAGSAKKPKLTRTGSITRGIRRSMSFAAIKTPIKSMLRSRRSSVDPNASGASIAHLESTFNESIKKPVKEKLRSIRDKITKANKKDQTPKSIKSKGLITPANLDSLKKVCNFKSSEKGGGAAAGMQTPEKSAKVERSEVDFKTPVAPALAGFGGGSSASRMITRSRGKLGDLTTAMKQHQAGGVGGPATSTSLHLRHSIATFGGLTLDETQPLPRPDNVQDDEHEETMPCETNQTTTNATSAATSTPPPDCDDAEMMPVVYEHIVQTKPETKNKNTHIVKADWFWYTIQAGYANEVDYLFADYLNSIAQTPVVDRRESLPVSFNKRKRKRLSQRTPAEGTPLSAGKRRSSVSDAGLLSVSGSFLDCTTSPDKHHESSKKNIIAEAAEPAADQQQPAKAASMRQNHFMDFFHTESNYVGILDTIVKLFKEPLEEMVESENPLLNKSELKSVFGNFLPIHDVHKRMLDRLKEIHSRWSEEALIGQIVLDHRDDLLKAYPPYVNFFEQMKETLVQCDASNPRFHAFLKINQAKSECGRQSLQDLMIRPVQRLPSISLLLNDILKHTAKTNPDNKKLDDALKAIKEVMTYINEDKRKTEGQKAMFDIFNDIDNCPPHLVSSHRSFVSRCEVTELSDSLSGRGDPLVLFLFSDTLEVCKKRSRVFNNVKSPSTNSLNLTRSSCATTKPYKHVKLMPLSTIRLLVNIVDSPRAFILIGRELSQNAKDRQYSFSMADEEQDKIIYLRSLAKQMAENACRTDAGHFLLNSTSDEVDIDVSDTNVGTLSKAFKFASKTRIRVGRAFSFNKTPSKLKRAVSTMMTSQFGSTQSLTPASQLAQMKLASCTNLNEVGEETGASGESSPCSSKTLVAPMSVQPTRKNKNPHTSIGTLRHL